MKPVHIVILVLAGALGGAGIMRLVQRPHVPEAEVAVAPPQPQQVAAAPVQEPASAPAVAPVAEPPKPSPVKSPVLETPKPAPVRVARPKPPKPVHVASAPVHVAPRIVPPPVQSPVPPAPTPGPEPPKKEVAAVPEPAPQPVSPARPEPEHVTPPVVAPQPEVHRVTLNAGLLIPVRLLDGLSSERNSPGDTFTATLDHELVADGFVIAERGARVEGRVTAADRGTKMKGGATLSVELVRLHTSDGQSVALQTDTFEKHMDASRRADAEKLGAGAAIGAVIGAIAAGGKGAAVGAGVGGGAGAGDVLLTRKQATLPTETRVSFRLRAPVTLVERL